MATLTPINNFAVSIVGNDTLVSKRTSAKGRDIGTRATFGAATYSEVRASLKASGLKGNELTRSVNEVVNEGKDLANAKAAAVTSALISKGFVADYLDISAKGTSANMRWVKPSAPVEKVIQAPTADTFKAWFASLSAEEKAALLK